MSDPSVIGAGAAGEFFSWHRGRPRYALWAVLLDCGAVNRRLAAARRDLADLLLPGYQRQAHITLQVCGFPVLRAQAADDFDAIRLAAQVTALDAAGVAPFSLRIGDLASFATAPYLQVAEDGSLERLREALGDAGISGADFRFVPHLTVGLYGREMAGAALAARFAKPRFAAELPVVVERIHLLSYQSAQLGGPLSLLASYDLARRRLLPTPALNFDCPP